MSDIKLKELIKDTQLNEFTGNNYLDVLFDSLVKIKKSFDKEKVGVYKWIKDNKFSKTSADRQFQSAVEHFDALMKYIKMAKKSIDYVTTNK